MKDYESIAREIVYKSEYDDDLKSLCEAYPWLGEELERIVFAYATALRETAEPLEREIESHKRHIETLRKKIGYKSAAYKRLKAETYGGTL